MITPKACEIVKNTRNECVYTDGTRGKNLGPLVDPFCQASKVNDECLALTGGTNPAYESCLKAVCQGSLGKGQEKFCEGWASDCDENGICGDLAVPKLKIGSNIMNQKINTSLIVQTNQLASKECPTQFIANVDGTRIQYYCPDGKCTPPTDPNVQDGSLSYCKGMVPAVGKPSNSIQLSK
jgi:hypothetical protein